MYIIQVRSIREGRECWEDYASGDKIDDIKSDLKEYEEIFEKNEVRIIKVVK